MVLLGLSQAEAVNTLLQTDIQQQDRDDYITEETDGWPINDLRFKSAEELASSMEMFSIFLFELLIIITEIYSFLATLLVMYIASAISAIYALSSYCLLCGIFRSWSALLLPWLIVDMVGVLLTMDLMLLFSHGCSVVAYLGGPTNYWVMCGAILCFNFFNWIIIHAYYSTLKKIHECAVIAIPCPCPTASATPPYYYQRPPGLKDSMLLGYPSLA